MKTYKEIYKWVEANNVQKLFGNWPFRKKINTVCYNGIYYAGSTIHYIADMVQREIILNENH